MGIPYLEKRNDKLCIFFKPHKELYKNGVYEFYAPQYTVAWVYPFKHLVQFENLLYSEHLVCSEPVKQISGTLYLKKSRYILNELYQECSKVLSFQERDGKVSDVSLKKYQTKYWDTVCELGLNDIYGERPL